MLFIINKVNVKVPDLITLVNIAYCSKFHLGMAKESFSRKPALQTSVFSL
jgi:hypothetical protein